jgi:hypothetical protein
MLPSCNDPDHPQKGDTEAGLVVAFHDKGPALVELTDWQSLREICLAQQDELEAALAENERLKLLLACHSNS